MIFYFKKNRVTIHNEYNRATRVNNKSVFFFLSIQDQIKFIFIIFFFILEFGWNGLNWSYNFFFFFVLFSIRTTI
jgi:hypothetical protein